MPGLHTPPDADADARRAGAGNHRRLSTSMLTSLGLHAAVLLVIVRLLQGVGPYPWFSRVAPANTICLSLPITFNNRKSDMMGNRSAILLPAKIVGKCPGSGGKMVKPSDSLNDILQSAIFNYY